MVSCSRTQASLHAAIPLHPVASTGYGPSHTLRDNQDDRLQVHDCQAGRGQLLSLGWQDAESLHGEETMRRSPARVTIDVALDEQALGLIGLHVEDHHMKRDCKRMAASMAAPNRTWAQPAVSF